MASKARGDSPGTGLDNGGMLIVYSNTEELSQLLNIDEPFLRDEAPINAGLFKRCTKSGIIYSAEEVHDGGKHYHKWALHPDAEHKIRNREGPMLPCGHHWAINHAADDVDDPFQCPADHCDETYSRETVEKCAP